MQERRLGETRLFVLPVDLAGERGRAVERARALVLRACRPGDREAAPPGRSSSRDRHRRSLAAHTLRFPEQVSVGIAGWRNRARRERRAGDRTRACRGTGLEAFDLGPCIWVRDHWFADMDGWGGQSERIFLVRVAPFEPAPQLDLAAELIGDMRWWTLAEISAQDVFFSPRRLPALVGSLLEHGPPTEPIDVGV